MFFIGSKIMDSLIIDNSIKLNAENYCKFLHKTFLMSQPRGFKLKTIFMIFHILQSWLLLILPEEVSKTPN